MITEDKITEIFCMADDFCKFFDAMTVKYMLKPIREKKISSQFHDVKDRSHDDNDSFPRFRLSLL